MAIISRKTSGQEAAVAAVADGLAPAGQRIRIGLTVLAAIFLLVLIAAAGMRPTRSVAPADSAGEPLANLGVAPGAPPVRQEAAKPAALPTAATAQPAQPVVTHH
jgi:hypothetical protein